MDDTFLKIISRNLAAIAENIYNLGGARGVCVAHGGALGGHVIYKVLYPQRNCVPLH